MSASTMLCGIRIENTCGIAGVAISRGLEIRRRKRKRDAFFGRRAASVNSAAMRHHEAYCNRREFEI